MGFGQEVGAKCATANASNPWAEKYGFSFSWKRALGISAAKGKLSRQLGVPAHAVRAAAENGARGRMPCDDRSHRGWRATLRRIDACGDRGVI